MADVIRQVLVEHGVPKVGSAYEDQSLEDLYDHYQGKGRAYWVIEEGDAVLGGGGIGELEGAPKGTCELQKMYFSPQARGLGLGKKMIHRCLEFALKSGYTQCYLETMPFMTTARKLYESQGFSYLEGPMGATGHHACTVWMIKELKE